MLGHPFESRISLMLVTMLVVAIGPSRMFLRCLLKGRVFALAVSWPQIPPSPTTLPELDLLQEALSAAARTTAEHVGTLESSGAFSCSKMKPDNKENETSQMDNQDESNPTPSQRPLLTHENVKKRLEERENKQGRLIGHAHHAGLARPHLRHSELVQCAAWAHPVCVIATRLLAKRTFTSYG